MPKALPEEVESEWNRAEVPMPPSRPKKAPWLVVRFQNMPNRNVANSGALTKPNTNWMISMALDQRLTR